MTNIDNKICREVFEASLNSLNIDESNIILNKMIGFKDADKIIKDFIEDDFYISDEGDINDKYVSYQYEKPSDRISNEYVSGISTIFKSDEVEYLVFENGENSFSFSAPVFYVKFLIPDIKDYMYKIHYYIDYDPIANDYIQTKLVRV